jgi:DNA polymerase III delta subunit
MVAKSNPDIHTPDDLQKLVRAGKYKPVYYFFGEDDYRIIEAEKYLVGQFIPEAQRITNYRRFDGKKMRCDDLLSELAVYPMLGERQVFAVKNIQSF